MTLNVEVLGTVLGTVDGWDPVDELMHTYYNFKSTIPGLPSADTIVIDYSGGTLEVFDEEGNGLQIYQLKSFI